MSGNSRGRRLTALIVGAAVLWTLAGTAILFWLAQREPSTVKWSFPAGCRLGTVGVGPDGTVYAGSADGNVYAISPDGDELWRSGVGFPVGSGPVLDQAGNLYVMGRTDAMGEAGLCSLTKDGSIRWQSAIPVGGMTGFTAVADDMLFIGGCFGYVQAVGTDGEPRWTHQEFAGFGNLPTIDDGLVYIGCWNGRDPINFLYCFNFAGETLWCIDVDGGVPTTAVIDDSDVIYLGTNRGFKAFDHDGNLLWSALSGEQFWADPVIGADGTLYCSTARGDCCAINPDGSLRWRHPIKEPKHTMITARGGLVLGPDGAVYIAVGAIENPSWLDVLFHGPGSPSEVPGPGKLLALSPDDGHVLWEYENDVSLECTPAIGPDGTVYVVTWDGMLYALAPP